ncbi:MAG: hypothetical protein ACRCVA_25255, partial [Phreatobacter sp.]
MSFGINRFYLILQVPEVWALAVENSSLRYLTVSYLFDDREFDGPPEITRRALARPDQGNG